MSSFQISPFQTRQTNPSAQKTRLKIRIFPWFFALTYIQKLKNINAPPGGLAFGQPPPTALRAARGGIIKYDEDENEDQVRKNEQMA